MAKVNIPIRTMIETDLHPVDSFRILCHVLEMDYVLNEFMNFYVKEEDGELGVYVDRDGEPVLYDERGDLFVALRNVAICICPNLGFKDADYIYSGGCRNA